MPVLDDEVNMQAVAAALPGGALEVGPSPEALAEADALALEAEALAKKKFTATPEKGKKRPRKAKTPKKKQAAESGDASEDMSVKPVSKRACIFSPVEDQEGEIGSSDELDVSQPVRGVGTSSPGLVPPPLNIRKRTVQYPLHPYTTTKFPARVLSTFYRNWARQNFIEAIDVHTANASNKNKNSQKSLYMDMVDFFKKVCEQNPFHENLILTNHTCSCVEHIQHVHLWFFKRIMQQNHGFHFCVASCM